MAKTHFNREKRRQLSIKGKDFYGELTHTVIIADLKVYTNKNMPDGVMIVSEAEADRLQGIVDKAVSDHAKKQIADDQETIDRHVDEIAEDDGKVSIMSVFDMIAKINNAGGKVNKEEYAIYVRSDAEFKEDRASFPLEVITAEDESQIPDGMVAIVAKKEGK